MSICDMRLDNTAVGGLVDSRLPTCMIPTDSAHIDYLYIAVVLTRVAPVDDLLTKVRALDGSEKTPELLQELFEEGTKQLIDCLPGVWDGSAE